MLLLKLASEDTGCLQICHIVSVVTKYWPGRSRSRPFAALRGQAYSRQGLLWLQANTMTLANCPRIWAAAQSQKDKHSSSEIIIKKLFFLAQRNSHWLHKSAHSWESWDGLNGIPRETNGDRKQFIHSSTIVKNLMLFAVSKAFMDRQPMYYTHILATREIQHNRIW